MDRQLLRVLSALQRRRAEPSADERKQRELEIAQQKEEEFKALQTQGIYDDICRETGCNANGSVRNVVDCLRERELGTRSLQFCRKNSKKVHISQRYLPTWLRSQNHYDARVFCGKFSKDGNIFMTACQDQHLRLYHTESSRFSEWQAFKDIACRDVGWAIVDVDYSPDSRFAIYSTWSNCVQLCNVFGNYELHEALEFRDDQDRFCLFSIKFSSDNREILGGSNDGCIYVFDIERKQLLYRVPAHSDDVNTVAFAEPNSQVFFSGSDDNLVKVWDRRLLTHTPDDEHLEQQPVGILAGHGSGITHIDSKGDGNYLISNSKDQSIKLWDLRKMSNSAPSSRNQMNNWDYRWGADVPLPTLKSGDDCSIMTYRGHRVTDTLIRCYFSPAATTGQRFIYSASSCGHVFLYDILTGSQHQYRGHRSVVRDVSWHPQLPILLSSSWDCSVGRWEYHPGALQDNTSFFRSDSNEASEVKASKTSETSDENPRKIPRTQQTAKQPPSYDPLPKTTHFRHVSRKPAARMNVQPQEHEDDDDEDSADSDTEATEFTNPDVEQ